MTGSPFRKAPRVMPWNIVATSEPPAKAWSHRRQRPGRALKRNSKATPRKISPTSISVNGRYSALSTTEYASGKAASRPAPPSTSQVSLPSQTGATVFIMTSRSAASGKNGNSRPIPRSKPSITTYIITPNRMMMAHSSGRSIPMGRLLVGGRERPHRLARLAGAARPRVASGLLRARGQQPQPIGGARAEHGQVDEHEQRQRETDLARVVRRDRIGGALQSIDNPGLAADLGGVPARQDGGQPGRRHGGRAAQEGPRAVQPR